MTIAQGLQEWLGAVTKVLSRAQAPTRRLLVDKKSLVKPPGFLGNEEDLHVSAKKTENYVSGVFPNMLGALVFAVTGRDHRSSGCAQSPHVRASTSSRQQEAIEAFRVGASCTKGGTRTLQKLHCVS